MLECSGLYFTWNRWGRLGTDGQSALAPYGSEELAIKGFSKKFKDKTKNSWDERDNFVKHNGKYQLIETEGGDGDEACADSVLGKLTESQINKGQRELAEILKILESGSKSGCTELSGEYYPTTSGMKQPPVIDNMELWTEKQSLLELWLRMGFEERAGLENRLQPQVNSLNVSTSSCDAPRGTVTAPLESKLDLYAKYCEWLKSKIGRHALYRPTGEPVKVLQVHLDDITPYLTIRMPNGMERQTTTNNLVLSDEVASTGSASV